MKMQTSEFGEEAEAGVRKAYMRSVMQHLIKDG
jgi:hypothetical protein